MLRTGSFISGYQAELSIKNLTSETINVPMFKFYDSPNEWRSFIDDMYWVHDKEFILIFHPNLFAHNKDMYLLSSTKNKMFGDVKVSFNIPSDSEIKKIRKYVVKE